MIEEYAYRPPIKYLFVGLGGLIASVIFGGAIVKGDEIAYSIIIGIFFLMTLAMGIGLSTLYFRKLNAGTLKLGTDFIEIPGRWREPIRLSLNDIINIAEFDTYDHIIEVESKQGVHLIERNWMKHKDFDSVKRRLKEHWLNK